MFGLFRKRAPTEPVTLVDCRYNGIPARHWRARVQYDVWGTPYVQGGSSSNFMDMPLLASGHLGGTGATGLFQWRHHSGPDVRFPEDREGQIRRGWRPST